MSTIREFLMQRVKRRQRGLQNWLIPAFFWTHLADTHPSLQDSLRLLPIPVFRHPRGLPGKHSICPTSRRGCRTQIFVSFAWQHFPSFATAAHPARRLSAGIVAVADVSLIHHHNGLRFGKQPKHPQKIVLFAPIFADQFLVFPLCL